MTAPRLVIVVNIPAFFISHRLPLAVAAKKAGFDVHVATAPGPEVAQIVNAGLRHHPIPLSRSGMHPLSELQLFLTLMRLFNALRPDVVHLVTIKPVLYGGIAARLTRVRGVVAAVSGLGFVFVGRRGLKATIVRTLIITLYRLAFGKRALRVIFQNPDDRHTLVRAAGLQPEKAVMIRGSGVALAEYEATPAPTGIPIVAMAARLLGDKGVREFVAAAERLKRRGAHAEFWLIGDIDLDNPASITQEELDAWRRADVLELLGRRDDIPELFARSSIVVLPSYGEGLPRVLMEAAACGRPVVTTDIPGCRDAIETGITGLLVPARDSAALADAIERLLGDPDLRARMGRAGRDFAEREFSIELVVAKHLTLYRELASGA